METIFECGAKNGRWVLPSFRTDHLDGRKDRLDDLLSDDLGRPGPQQGPPLEPGDRETKRRTNNASIILVGIVQVGFVARLRANVSSFVVDPTREYVYGSLRGLE